MEIHRIVSTTLDVQDGTLYATILYEEIDAWQWKYRKLVNCYVKVRKVIN